jgi:hypothetical protein
MASAIPHKRNDRGKGRKWERERKRGLALEGEERYFAPLPHSLYIYIYLLLNLGTG